MAEKEEVSYTEIVKEVMEQGHYYSDAVEWYANKYYSIIAEKTMFILLSIFSIVTIFYIRMTIKNVLPLRETFPIYKLQKDAIKYRTVARSLKPQGKVEYTSNEAILRMLLIHYTKEMFTHNYKSGNLEDLNTKLLRIGLYSSNDLLEKYKRGVFDGVTKDIFNKNIEYKTTVVSFKLIKKGSKLGKKKSALTAIKDYFFSKVPQEAELTCVTDTLVDGVIRAKTARRILFNYSYEPIVYNMIKDSFTEPRLVVNDYRILEETKNEVVNN
jgi:type IV secretory pathway component VirB8